MLTSKNWKNTIKKVSGLLAFGLIGFASFAQEAAAVEQTFIEKNSVKIAFWLSLAVMWLLLAIILYLANMLVNAHRKLIPEEQRSLLKNTGILPHIDWKQFWTKINDAVPVVQEDDVMLDHDYDGIRELDNHLPPWWKWMFYLSIAFGVAYMLHYHVLGTGPDQIEHYEMAMEKAEIAKAEYLAQAADLVDETNVELLTDATSMAKGEKVYIDNCVVCHGTQGEGGTGPSFSDYYWLHGNDIKDIFTTIKYGIAGKGMREWESLLTPSEMAAVGSYILEFQGTSPEGVTVKPPQGEFMGPDGETALDSAATAPIDSLEAMVGDSLEIE